MKSTFIAGVAFFALFSMAQAQTFGNWVSGTVTAGDAMYATTINDSGNLLGQYCFPADGKCVWLLAMKARCNDGDRYSILANSDAGAAHLEIYCSGRLDSGLYRYVFSKFDAINDIVLKGWRVGFAVPMESDQFRVVRFDLSHSNQAIAAMKAEAQRAQRHERPSTRHTGTRDVEL